MGWRAATVRRRPPRGAPGAVLWTAGESFRANEAALVPDANGTAVGPENVATMSSQHWLVTGGLGFIGSAFVRLSLRERPDLTITVLDAMTYAGNPANLASLAGDKRYRFVQGSICERAAVDAAIGGARRCDREFCRRNARRPFDPRTRSVSSHGHPGNPRAARSGAGKAHRALSAGVDGRSLRTRARGFVGRRRSAGTALPVRCIKGGRRPASVGLSHHVRRADSDHPRVEYLRTLPVSREAHPAVHHQSAR